MTNKEFSTGGIHGKIPNKGIRDKGIRDKGTSDFYRENP